MWRVEIMSMRVGERVFNKIREVPNLSSEFKLIMVSPYHYIIRLYDDDLHIIYRFKQGRIEIYPNSADIKTFPSYNVWQAIRRCRSLGCIYWKLFWLWDEA